LEGNKNKASHGEAICPPPPMAAGSGISCC